ncbi:MAG: DUF3841 domain-containing protein [Prevotella sp.]|nr:DUF3841 domain-containing protein [Prevotella sp.]
MRLWTIQGIEIYEQLKRDGIAYCTKPYWGDEPIFMYAYQWMAKQMRQRIGEPPIDGIEYPIWAWYQYDSAKKRKPPRSLDNIPEGMSAYMEIEVPDNEVLLSGFSVWHAVLNQCPIDDWKAIDKVEERLEKEAGRKLDYNEYPPQFRDRIEKTWEEIFNLDRRDANIGRRHKRNRSIQATFWMLKQEYIVSVEILKREGDVIKTIHLYDDSGHGVPL